MNFDNYDDINSEFKILSKHLFTDIPFLWSLFALFK